MGVESYLLASALLGVLAQRLVRRVCKRCGQPVELGPELLHELAPRGEPVGAMEGRGCEECAQTGYRGRGGIYELLPVDDGVKGLILERAPSGKLKDYAVSQGMRTLRDDGWRSVRIGSTTVAEVVRVTQVEV
jgi:general secretion pathway protein E